MASRTLSAAIGLLTAAATITIGLPAAPAQAATLRVTASVAAQPRYGDAVQLTVSTNDASSAWAKVYWDLPSGTDPLLTEGDVTGGATLSIATTGRFPHDVTQHLRVEAAGEVLGSGTAVVDVTTTAIPRQLGFVDPTITYGDPLVVSVTPTVGTPIAPTGTVVLHRGDLVVDQRDLVDGRATFPLVVGGSYQLTAEYVGDLGYAAATTAQDVSISPLGTSTQLTLSRTTAAPGDEVDAFVTVDPVRAGVTVFGNAVIEAAPVGSTDWQPVQLFGAIGETATLHLDEFVAEHHGAFQVRARLVGNVSFAESSAVKTLTITGGDPDPEPLQAELTLPSGPIVYGTTRTATLHVTASDGSTVSGTARLGPVEAFAAASDAQVVPVVDGVAHFDLSGYEVGSHWVAATYNGDGVHSRWSAGTTTIDVVKAPTTVRATAPAQARPGTRVTVTATAPGSTARPTGSVTVTEHGRTLGQVALASGTGSFALPALAPGPHQLTLQYAGGERFEGSTATVPLTVARPASSVTGSARPVARHRAKVTVVVRGAASPTGAVTIRDGGRVVARASLTAARHGRLVLTTASLRPGRHRLVVTYGGSSTLAGSQSHPLTVRVR